MSLDPEDLELGSKVVFSEKVNGTVVRIDHGTDEIGFDSGFAIKIYSPLWELAELVEPELPFYLCFMRLDNDGKNYVLRDDLTSISPSRLLNRLRQDVAALEAVGVEEGE